MKKIGKVIGVFGVLFFYVIAFAATPLRTIFDDLSHGKYDKLNDYINEYKSGKKLLDKRTYYLCVFYKEYAVDKTLTQANAMEKIQEVIAADTDLTVNQKVVIQWNIMYFFNKKEFGALVSKEQLKSYTDAHVEVIKKSNELKPFFIKVYAMFDKEQAYELAKQLNQKQRQLQYAIQLKKSPSEIKEILNSIRIGARKLKPGETLFILNSISQISYDSTYDNEVKAMLTAMNRALYPKLQNKEWEQSLIQLKLVMKAYGLE